MPSNQFYALIDDTMQKRPDAPALSFFRQERPETFLTYGQLKQEVSAWAGKLQAQGIQTGDRVILFMQKSVIAVVTHLALLKLGVIAVPLNPGFKAREMAYLLGDADPALVLCEARHTAWLRGIASNVPVMDLPADGPYVSMASSNSSVDRAGDPPVSGGNEPALIVYTSGTTGNPKGAVLTQKNLIHDVGNIIDIWEIGPSDVLCHALPLFHIHGLSFALHTALVSGAHVKMTDRFDPGFILAMLSAKGEHACSVFMAVPTMYTKIMDHSGVKQADFHHLRLLTSGSAPLLETEFQRIEQMFGQSPVEREGMSETGMNFSNPLRGRRKPGSIGLPLPGLDVRIVDPYMLEDVAAGNIGEIWLKGPGITPGYWRKPEETRKAFHDGWFRTGDLGRVDPDGYYYLTDRLKHIIISGGENVSAREVEMVINNVEGVAESAVVGMPDPKWGERVAAVVSLQAGARVDEKQVLEHCRRNLHDWKCPKTIRFVAELPRNTMGKVLKAEIKKILTETQSDDP